MLGNKIKALRLRKGDSLQQVADAVGVSKPHIWELEQNRSKKPSFDLVVKLATYFGVSIELFISEDGEETQPEEALIFGHKFDGATEEQKKVILDMAKQIIK